MWRAVLAVGVVWAGGAGAASPIQMAIPCQQNLSDGRVLIDGSLLPAQARYKVLHYAPNRSEGGWSYGQCQLSVTRGASG